MKLLLTILLLFFVWLETYSQVIGIRDWEVTTASLVYFISGIFIAILPLIKIKPNPPIGENYRIIREFFLLIYITFIAGLIFYGFQWAITIFEKFPLDYKVADMLPIIQKMCERFADGRFVYETVPFWEGTEPIYLPAMWLPYLPFTIFDIDIRWASMLFLLIGVHLIYFIGEKGAFTFKSIFIFIPLYFLFDSLFHTDFKLIYLSEEPVVIFYYLFLAYALAKNRPYLIGIALSLCLLSRFALLFWAIMYWLYLFLFKNRNDAIKIAITIAVISVILLFATGAIWQLKVIIDLPNIYVAHLMENEWKYNGLTATNLGLLKFFPFSTVPLVHQLFFVFNILIPAGSLLFYWKYRGTINEPLFAICSLKLSLVFFYNFLIMPFSYLFYTSTFLSIAILSWYLKEDYYLNPIK